ncbi:hypothetical protein QJS10_CPA03g00445 [Acorus calamus]|uniref:Uncharacterized protein n=1 Tax=Acorus calamus TaxID=4465 RepID=A0AAV9F413_ACOCL|nr:hypothetical protein QJS10_CPA03g00445 [Acorus calamus]
MSLPLPPAAGSRHKLSAASTVSAISAVSAASITHDTLGWLGRLLLLASSATATGVLPV